MKSNKLFVAFAVLALTLSMLACGVGGLTLQMGPTSTPLPTNTPLATNTPLPTATPRPTATPIPTATSVARVGIDVPVCGGGVCLTFTSAQLVFGNVTIGTTILQPNSGHPVIVLKGTYTGDPRPVFSNEYQQTGALYISSGSGSEDDFYGNGALNWNSGTYTFTLGFMLSTGTSAPYSIVSSVYNWTVDLSTIIICSSGQCY